MLLRSSATVAKAGSGEWWRARRHWARGWTIEAARRPACSTGSPKPTPCSTRRRLCSVILKLAVKRRTDAFYSTCVPPALHGAGEWAYTQSMFQAPRIWELGKHRRVLCLRRRSNECWADHMKRTGVIVSRNTVNHACKLWLRDVCVLLLGRW